MRTQLKSAHAQFLLVQKEAGDKTARVKSLELELESVKLQAATLQKQVENLTTTSKATEERAMKYEQAFQVSICWLYERLYG